MIKLFLRTLGAALLIGALIALGYDLYIWIKEGYFEPYFLGQLWYSVSPGSLNLTQAITERYLDWRLWDYGIGQLVLWPVWVTFGPLAFLFRWLGR